MHKSELEGMTLAELTALAGELGAELSNDQTTLIYNILDAQSLKASAEPAPKKRGRKAKADSTPSEGESPSTTVPEEGEAAPAPKKRGRKSKAEKEAEAAASLTAEQVQDEATTEAAPAEAEKANAAEEAAPASKKRRKRIGEAKAEDPSPVLTFEEEEKTDADVPVMEEIEEPDDSPSVSDQPDFIIIQDIPSAEEQARELAPSPTPSAEEEVIKKTPAPRNETGAGQYNFGDNIRGEGVLEVMPEGFGFLRSSALRRLGGRRACGDLRLNRRRLGGRRGRVPFRVGYGNAIQEHRRNDKEKNQHREESVRRIPLELFDLRICFLVHGAIVYHIFSPDAATWRRIRQMEADRAA